MTMHRRLGEVVVEPDLQAAVMPMGGFPPDKQDLALAVGVNAAGCKPS